MMQRAAGTVTLGTVTLAFSQDPGVVDIDTLWFKVNYSVDWTDWNVSSAIPFLSGHTYTVMARSRDRAGSHSVPYSSRTFTYDNMSPESAVVLPANGSIITALSAIRGALIDVTNSNPPDNISTGAVTTMRLKIKRLSDNQYWTGGGWLVGEQVIQTPAAGMDIWVDSWTIKPGNLPTMTPGTSYYLTTQGVDNAADGGNAEPYDHVRSSTFTFDDGPPVASIVVPIDNGYYSVLTGINGGSTDNVGVSTISVSVQQVGGNCYRPGSFNDFGGTCPNWFKAQGSTTAWSFPFATPPWVHNTQYVVRSSATDLAGNIQGAAVASTFTFDVIAPTVALTTPSLGLLNQNQTIILGTALDSPADIDTVVIAISSDTSGVTASWYSPSLNLFNAPFSAAAYMTTTTFVPGSPAQWGLDLLAPEPIQGVMEDGKTYLVRVRARDRSVPVKETVQEFTFLYDQTRPVAIVTSPSDGSYKTGLVAVAGTSDDPDPAGPPIASGVSTVTISIQRLLTGNCFAPGAGFTVSCPNYLGGTGARRRLELHSSRKPIQQRRALSCRCESFRHRE